MTTQPRERPILFSAPMVRAILDGRKTQTRRVVKPQPPSIESVTNHAGIGYHWMNCADQGYVNEWRPVGPVWAVMKEIGEVKPRLTSPYGNSGDRLWVRETWAKWTSGDCKECCAYRADGGQSYEWRPSIHMPRWASRLTLEITGVRVERLQEISGDDCLAEGIEPQGIGSDMAMRVAFQALWESINGPGSWDANPWVWIVEFRRMP